MKLKKNLRLIIDHHLDNNLTKFEIEEQSLEVSTAKVNGRTAKGRDIKSSSVKSSKNSDKSTTSPASLDVEKVYNKTRKLYDVNVNLLQQREKIEELLTNYEEITKELFEL